MACSMVALAIILKRSPVSLPLALAARPLKRSRRSLARVIRPVCSCLASCRITTSRSASAMLFYPLRKQYQCGRDYADRAPPWQFPATRHPQLPVTKTKKPRCARGSLLGLALSALLQRGDRAACSCRIWVEAEHADQIFVIVRQLL